MPVRTENGGKRRSWRAAGWGAAAILLLAPLAAMQVTDAVAWTLFDFAVFAGMLAVAGGTVELAAHVTGDRAYRAAVAFAIAAAFLLVWLNGAVGIIGSEDHPANLIYGGVLIVAIGGSVIARFRPRGMALAMMVTALAQALVAVAALAGGMGRGTPKWPWGMLVLTGLFVAIWVLSAALFRKSTPKFPPSGPRA